MKKYAYQWFLQKWQQSNQHEYAEDIKTKRDLLEILGLEIKLIIWEDIKCI